MTAGIPGAGIAGLFYLACALLMPIRAGWRAIAHRSRGTSYPGTFVLKHVALAAAMLGSLWVAAWLIGWFIALASAPTPGAAAEAARAWPRAIGRTVVWLTAGTLVGVLLSVEVLRLVLRTAQTRRKSGAALVIAGLLLGPTADVVARTTDQPAAAADVAALVARADAAYDRGAADEAAALYEAVLKASPTQPRALYRLGQLRRKEPLRAIALFEAYTRAVPRDAWGHLALSSALADAGRYQAALAAYERADELEPADRDIALGRPRLLARIGEPSLAFQAYRAWLAEHADDVEAWSELAAVAERLRRWPAAADALDRLHRVNPDDEQIADRLAAARSRAAPALEFGGVGIGETDVTTFGLLAGGDVAAGDVARIGGLWHRRRIDSLGEVVVSDRFLGHLVAQPSPELRLQLVAGVVRRREDVDGGLAVTSPEVRARLRRRFAAGRGGLDLRGQYGPVDATPGLALDELTRGLVSGAFDAPIGGRWHARGLGSLWTMTRPDEDANRGFRVGGSVAFEAAPALNVSGGWQQSRYRDPAVGYFAPERAELVEGGVDLERERGIFALSLDAGAGVQRVQRHGEPMGAWDLALRGWAMLAWTLAPGRQFTVEIEAYDSQVTDRVVVSTERWRYASVTAGLRIALQ